MQLAPGTYELVATNARTMMRLKPWWAQLANPELRACIFDVPKMWPFPGVNGTQVFEWGAKSPADNPRSDPPGLVHDFKRRYGVHRGTLLDEDVTERPAYFPKLLKALLDSCRLRTEICLDLLHQEPWDLFVHVFSESHSVGHRYIHFLEGDTSRGSGHEMAELRAAMQSVYQEIDRGIGRICEALPPNATIVSCSMHGMGLNENSEVSELLPELLRRYSLVEGDCVKPLAQRLRSRSFVAAHALTPSIVRDKVKHHLSQGVRKRVRMERLRCVHDQDNWAQMKAFSLPSDEGGFVRINLEGREPQGRIAPEAFDEVVAELAEIFEQLHDPTTGTAAVRRVRRVREEQHGAYVDALPDLVIEWTRQPLRELESPHFGHLGRHDPHRAGTHRPRGYLVASGPGIPEGREVRGGSVFDIAPTLLGLLDEPIQAQMVGRSIIARTGT